VIRVWPARDRGESLIELLVAVTIMGITVVAVIGGLTTSIVVSDISREHAQAAAHIRAYAAQMQEAVATGGYDAVCPVTEGSYPDYPSVDGFVGQVEPGSVKFWDEVVDDFVEACSISDTGIQMVTVVVTGPGDRVEERLNLILRRP
jgi:hypothetical protein